MCLCDPDDDALYINSRRSARKKTNELDDKDDNILHNCCIYRPRWNAVDFPNLIKAFIASVIWPERFVLVLTRTRAHTQPRKVAACYSDRDVLSRFGFRPKE